MAIHIYCEISEMLLNESQENFGVFEKMDKNTIFSQLKWVTHNLEKPRYGNAQVKAQGAAVSAQNGAGRLKQKIGFSKVSFYKETALLNTEENLRFNLQKCCSSIVLYYCARMPSCPPHPKISILPFVYGDHHERSVKLIFSVHKTFDAVKL